MKENPSSFGQPEFRIVGSASDKKKEKIRQELLNALFDNFNSLSPKERSELEKLEYPKSEKELECIEFANNETDQLMNEAGVTSYDIPTENYRIVPPELHAKISDDNGPGMTFYFKQGILLNAKYVRSNPFYFGAVALHETLHLKGHTAFEATKEDEIQEENEAAEKSKKTIYRVGISAISPRKLISQNKLHEHFEGLNEAIVATQEKKSLRKLLGHPALKEENEWFASEEAQILRKKVAEISKIDGDDIIWIDKQKNDNWVAVPYSEARQTLDYVCIEIQKQFPEKYASKDDVFKEFLKTHFTGNLLPIARLVEKTFGEGNFRLLGNMEPEKESAILHMESLQKARIRQLKKLGL